MVALAVLSTGCYRDARQGHSMSFRMAQATGTCEGACQHYLGCKGESSAETRATCLAECQEIFVFEGEEDRTSLRDFEGLQCESAVAFVDGDRNPDRRPQEDSATRASTAP
jgi:hypothetical protein